ncbi:hypothetical protein [Liquorilactobacillus nagelii]
MIRKLNDYFGLDGWDQYLFFYGYIVLCVVLPIIAWLAKIIVR